MTKSAHPDTEFRTKLHKAIINKVLDLRNDGTVSMSLYNLMQLVRPPSNDYAKYYYNDFFTHVCKDSPVISEFTSSWE